MKIDIRKMSHVNRDGTHICDSKLLLEEVPWIQINYTGLYFIPVDGKRIWDPLFNKDLHIVGTIIGVNIQSNDTGIYVDKQDTNKLTVSDEISVEDVGNTVIATCGIYAAYSDGIHAYMEYFNQLIEINYVVWFDELDVGDFVFGDICRFMNSPNNVEMYEKEIVPNLQPKPLLPMLIKRANKSVTEIHKDIETLIEREKQVKTNLSYLRSLESKQQEKGEL